VALVLLRHVENLPLFGPKTGAHWQQSWNISEVLGN
jgi:hypothetical protein